MNGVYVSLDKEYKIIDGIKGFYLYANGMYRYEYFENNFWRDPKKELKKRQLYYETSNDFGQYRIHNDTIIIRDFASNNNEFFSKWIIEDKGVILNDSTIKIFSSYSYLGKIELINEPQIHRFYPTKVKPDSTNLFYKNKKWYQEGLHESRK